MDFSIFKTKTVAPAPVEAAPVEVVAVEAAPAEVVPVELTVEERLANVEAFLAAYAGKIAGVVDRFHGGPEKTDG